MKLRTTSFVATLTFLAGVVSAQTESKVLPTSGNENAWFGASVSIDNAVLIIGAPGNPDIIGNAGAAFVFEREGTAWIESARFAKPNGRDMQLFGHSVSVSGETVLVGAPRDDVGPRIDDGSAFVYVRGDAGWTQQARLTASDARSGHEFGYAVDIDGDTAVITAPEANDHRGAAYIFVRVGDAWQQQAVLTPSAGVSGDRFGQSVAITGDYVVIGAPDAQQSQGVAYLYARTGNSWAERAILRAEDGVARDGFGTSADINGPHLIVGAPYHDFENFGEYDEGTAYIFAVPGGSQIAKLRITEGIEGFAGQFNVGWSIGISGTTVIVGAIGSGGPGGMTGAAYTFGGGGWTQTNKIIASDGTEEDFFGDAVAISDGCPLIGARRDSPLAYESGAAYLYCGGTVPAEIPDAVTVDLDIFRPKVLDPAESIVAETDELSHGAQTVVNLDNDDTDPSFDINDVDGVSGGDNEFVRLEIRLQPADVGTGTVTLDATSGDDDIRIWHNADRTAEAELPISFDMESPGVYGFEAEGDTTVKTLWVEGVRPHTSQRSTTFKLTYQDSDAACTAPCEDEVALTVIGIQQQSWIGKQNGFTADSLSFNSDELDIDPRFPAGVAKGRRVFSGARAPEFSTPREAVDLEIDLSVAPVEPISLFVRSLDADDPSTDTTFVDPNDAGRSGSYAGASSSFSREEDNRAGTLATGKAGLFDGQDADKIATVVFAANIDKQKIGFRVSQFPGDNYRVAANADRDFVVRLRNRDGEDGFRIVDPYVTGSAAEREILDATRLGQPAYASDVLTVWRLLHVENDSMEEVADNFVSGNITAIAPGTGVATSIDVDVNLHDGSADLDSSAPRDSAAAITCEMQSPELGRFQHGNLLVASTTSLVDVGGNGDYHIVRSAGMYLTEDPLPFVATAADAGLTGTVTGIGQDEQRDDWWIMTLDITGATGSAWQGMVGGTISIDNGPGMEITSVLPNDNALTVGSLSIPFELTDDDDPDLLPQFSDLRGLDRFETAFVLAVADGGGGDHNDDTVPFVLNAPVTGGGAQWVFEDNRGSRDTESDAFWVVYVVGAYQTETCFAFGGEVRGDRDPNAEIPILGITEPAGTTHASNLATGGQGSLIFVETERDRWRPNQLRARHRTNVVHEVGHQFGLGHAQGQLMAGLPAMNALFAHESINLIRNRTKSPGAQ